MEWKGEFCSAYPEITDHEVLHELCVFLSISQHSALQPTWKL